MWEVMAPASDTNQRACCRIETREPSRIGELCRNYTITWAYQSGEDEVSVFLNINPKYIADAIHSAHSKVIYVSPGLEEVIASALINAAKKIGLVSCQV